MLPGIPVLVVVGMPLQAFFATMLFKNKSEPPLEKHEINAQPNPNLQNGKGRSSATNLTALVQAATVVDILRPNNSNPTPKSKN
ncbi:hypothetical protein V6N11_022338 [Hibiscus sabdariffa]|uniref:Uncharacterized protein n=1 Tax=Hibiscus sabdariffa TaxID=183260 RepID=A0ABR2TJ80_9ROSI